MKPSLVASMQRFAGPFAVFLLCIAASGNVEAIECHQCHGTDNPPDYRPLDSPSRNYLTGGFKGNHRTHMGSDARPSSCAPCHPGSGDYQTSHSNNIIDLSPAINSSPLPAVYRNGTTAIPQTSAPKLGSCSNVNCHFERETPAWGSAPLALPEGCRICHGSPPEGGDTGPAGSHALHDLYFPGITGCKQCHADHAHDTAPFAHATSAGRRNLAVRIQNVYTSVKASYSGPTDDYLPKSGNNMFGNCANVYCHSAGTGRSAFAPNVTPTWGTPLPADCSGCHGGDYRSGIELATGSHTIHMGRDYYGQYIYDCSTCHSATASDSRTIGTRSNHTNGKIDVVMKSGFGGTYSATGHEPGAAVGFCSNVYCHSNVQPDGGVGGPTVYAAPTWGQANSVNCGGCHAGDGGHAHGGAKISTGSHGRHLVYAFTTTGNATKCMICHKYTNLPFQSGCFTGEYGNTVCHTGAGAKHSNGLIDVRIDPVFGNISAYMGSPAPGNGYSNCVNTYCHSNGTSVATGTIPANTTTGWGSGSLACDACHGIPPGYVSGAAKANSHGKHAAYSCARCHYGTTTTGTTITGFTSHVNKAYDVSGAPGTTFTYTFAATGGSCSTISCHGGGSATWGTTLPCNSCHDAPPRTPAHLVHFSGTADQAAYGDTRSTQDFAPTATGYLMNCGNCHPLDRSRHGNGIVDVELFNPLSPQGSLKARNPATAAYSNGTTVHTDSRGMTYTNGTCSNIYCHSYTEWATPVDCVFTNESGSRYCDAYASAHVQATRVYRSPVWNSQLAPNCTGCHANGPRTTFQTNDGMTGDSHAWGNPWNYEQGHFNKEWFDMTPVTCNYCHNDTIKEDGKWWREPSPYYTYFSSARIANFSKHVNGTKDVAFEKTKPWTMVYAGWTEGTQTRTFDLSTASYAPETRTCTNVSCHRLQTSVTWGKPYRGYKAWDGIDYVCVECHGAY